MHSPIRLRTLTVTMLFLVARIHGQEVEPRGSVRVDTIPVHGKAVVGLPGRMEMFIERPHPAWLSTWNRETGARVIESVAYDSLLNSCFIERDTAGLPQRIEIQIMDSTFLSIAFHAGTAQISQVGVVRKYYGNFERLQCADQEDTLFIIKEMRCPCEYSDVLGIWNEPCSARIGEWFEYWPNGQLKARGGYYPKEFRAFKPDKMIVNGDEYFIELIRDGFVRVGTWDFFDNKGSMLKSIVFEPKWISGR